MKLSKAQYLAEHMNEQMARDRVFLNNPVVMQGLGIAPLVVMATDGVTALLLWLSMALLITPIRMIAAALCQRTKGRWRPFIFCFTAAVWYIPAYWVLSRLFGTDLLSLGIYLPLLVVEPLVVQRFETARMETPRDAFQKGRRFTLGVGVIVLLLGLLREFLTSATLFDIPMGGTIALLPIARLSGGGFILLGVVCAAWRGAVNRWKKYVNMEARRGK